MPLALKFKKKYKGNMCYIKFLQVFIAIKLIPTERFEFVWLWCLNCTCSGSSIGHIFCNPPQINIHQAMIGSNLYTSKSHVTQSGLLPRKYPKDCLFLKLLSLESEATFPEDSRNLSTRQIHFTISFRESSITFAYL